MKTKRPSPQKDTCADCCLYPLNGRFVLLCPLHATASSLLNAAKLMVSAIDDFLYVDENGDNIGDLDSVSNQLPNLRDAIDAAEGN